MNGKMQKKDWTNFWISYLAIQYIQSAYPLEQQIARINNIRKRNKYLKGLLVSGTIRIGFEKFQERGDNNPSSQIIKKSSVTIEGKQSSLRRRCNQDLKSVVTHDARRYTRKYKMTPPLPSYYNRIHVQYSIQYISKYQTNITRFTMQTTYSKNSSNIMVW